MKPLVSIIMGSDSDLPVMAKAAEVLEAYQVGYSMQILSAHRTPEATLEFAKKAEENGYKVIIAGAGMAAHLPGVLAAQTVLPVIGVPIRGKTLDGQDALLSMVQMPPGIPVATVAINGAKNAAILSLQILALTEPSLKEALKSERQRMKTDLSAKNETLAELGYKNYIHQQRGQKRRGHI